MFGRKHSLSKNEIIQLQARRGINYSNAPLCMAPYQNLNFSLNGEILPCFYNKQYSYGHYYEGIDYIKLWKNQHFEKLRSQISNNNFSHGCLRCYNNIRNKANNHLYNLRYDNDYEINNDYPVSLEFQISNKCNFSCVKCNEEFSSMKCKTNSCNYDENIYYGSEFAASLQPLIPFAKRIVFTGGEPFLINEYKEIIQLCQNSGNDKQYFISTNASFINAEQFKFIENNNVILSISYDSANKEIFNTLAGIDAYQIVTDNIIAIKAINDKKGQQTYVKVCPMQQTIYSLTETYNFLSNLQIQITFNEVLYPPECTLTELSAAELSRIVEMLKNFRPVCKTQTEIANFGKLGILIATIEQYHKKAMFRENQNISHKKLRKQFISRINTYIKNYTIHEFSDGIMFFDAMFGHLDNSPASLKCIRYFSELPIFWLMGEMRFRNINPKYLKNRVNQAHEYFKNSNDAHGNRK